MNNILKCIGIGICLLSCNNDKETTILTNEIKLTSTIQVPSRGTNITQQTTELAEGQQVGITILHAPDEHNHVAWEVGFKGTLFNLGNTITWGENDITIYAYQPYQKEWTGSNSNETFSVSTDQNSVSGYLASDLLWSNQTATPTNESIKLTFVHKLAKINVMLTSKDIDDLSGATISICGSNITTLFNPQTGELFVPTEKNIADIKASVTTADAQTASCILIPQTINEGTPFIKIEHAKKTYTYKLPQTMLLHGGYEYTFQLAIEDGQINDVTGSVPDMPWG